MMPRKMLILAIVGLIAGSLQAEDYIDNLRKGNDAFRQQDYAGALEQYQIAEAEQPEAPEVGYNIGNALYEQQAYDEAVDNLQKALNTGDADLQSRAYYNLGNTHYRMGDYMKAIENYQEALEINPDDLDAKYNLELARRMLKEQSQQEQQDQNQQQQQQQEKEEQEQQDQQQREEEQQDQQQEQQQQQQSDPAQQNEKEQQQQQQQAGEQKPMSKEDAERILNALKDDEQEIQEKVKRHRAVATDYSGKDW